MCICCLPKDLQAVGSFVRVWRTPDTDTRKPLTNDSVVDIKVGQSGTVFLSPAHYYWWDNKKAYTCFKPILEANGYHGDFVPYVPLFEKSQEPMSETRSMNLQTAFSGGTIGHCGALLQHLQDNAGVSKPLFGI